jgi:trehalose 6-phosphate synthase
MCNPHDINSIKDSLMRAISARQGEATRRMQAMRRYLRDHGVRQWAADFLAALGTGPRPDTEAAQTDPTHPEPAQTALERSPA